MFGRPGSGKSFGVTRVIQSIFEELKTIEYEELKTNLSQFEKKEDLNEVFTHIREILKNIVPVVYFDEFDATYDKTPLYWVKDLEAFLQEVEPSRPRVYVFIGGTAETSEQFKLQPSARVKQLPPGQAVKDDEYPVSCERLRSVIESNFTSVKLATKTLQFRPAASTDKEATSKETTSKDLVGVFNWVKDPKQAETNTVSLKSADVLPIAFFDNFGETREGDTLGWLKSFLAPMQDGEFFDGETKGVYELGQAIFVFIEGNMGHFESFLNNPDISDVFKHAKGPDFVSRLSGQFANNIFNNPGDGAAEPVHLDQVLKGYSKGIEGYKAALEEYHVDFKAYKASLAAWKKEEDGKRKKEPMEPKPPKQPKPLSIGVFRTDDTTRKRFAKLLSAHIDIQGPNKVHDGDDMFVIRRAVMLRGMLKKRGLHGKFQPGSDVLRALLRVPRLRHGARSLETILAMSRIPGGVSGSSVPATEKKEEKDPEYFQKDHHLPPNSQLTLHVDLESWDEYLK